MERKQVVRMIKHCSMIDKEIVYNHKVLQDCKTQQQYSQTPEEEWEVMKHIQGENQKLATQKQEYTKELSKLEFVKKRILVQFYGEGRSWTYIALDQNYSESWCRAKRDDALDELGKHMETNEILNILAVEISN